MFNQTNTSMNFKVKSAQIEVQDLEKWSKKFKKAKKMYAFMNPADSLDEKEYLQEIIDGLNDRLRRLLKGYQVNSSLFSYQDAEKWKEEFNEAHKALAWHKAILKEIE